MRDQELTDPRPPTPDQVARRAIILTAVSCRGIVESDRANEQAARDLAERSYDWLHVLGLGQDLSDWERRVLASPFGSLADRDRINATWLCEGVTVLAWSLGKAEMLGFDEQGDPAHAANTLGFLQPKLSTVLNNPQLRSKEDLEEYNEFIYNLH